MAELTPPKPKTDWREKRKRRHLVTSATQHETFELCRRKWWLDSVRGLEVPATTSNVFGTCLHGVGERYFGADELGRDPKTGEPVNLYPPEWNVARSRFNAAEIEGVIGPEDQQLIARLVTQAIELGVWARRPGQEIEWDFLETVCVFQCPTCQGNGNVNNITCKTCDGDGKGTHVQIKGFIDLLELGVVNDHKSTKSMRWAKSKNKLRESRQMLIYGMVALMRWRREGKALPMVMVDGVPTPDLVELGHNIFCKDPEDERVKRVDVHVTVAELEAAWQIVQNNAAWMDFYRRTAENWYDLPNPDNRSACSAYGGCPFQRICGGQENEAGYEYRLAWWSSNGYSQGVPLTVNGSQTPVSQPGSTQMTQFAAALAAKGGGVPGAVPGQINPPAVAPSQMAAPAATFIASPPAGASMPAPAGFTAMPAQAPAMNYGQPPAAPPMQPQAPAPSAAPQPAPGAPPWAIAGETACGGTGWNTVGNPCGVCNMHTKNAGGRTAETFQITPLNNGFMRVQDPHSAWWMDSPLPVQRQEVPPQAAPPQQPQQPPQGGPPAGAPAQGAAPAEGDEKGKPGRKPKSYILVINGIVSRGVEARGDRRQAHLPELFKQAKEAIVQANGGASSFYDLDAFKRRDALSKIAEQMTEQCDTIFVSAPGISSGQSDYRAFFDVWMERAGCIITPAIE